MTFLLLLMLVVLLFAVLAGARGPIWGAGNNVTVIRRRRSPRVVEEVYEDDPVIVERVVERDVERDLPTPGRRRIVER